MLSIIWLGMMMIAVVFGVINHKLVEVAAAVTDYGKLSFNIALGLTGIMTFWLGLMKIAEKSGLMSIIAKGLYPILKRLFPELDKEDPALAAIVMNISANMLGLANAATPFGLKAMAYLQEKNSNKAIASNAMCMFLAINTSSVQLIPVTAIAFLAANGAKEPTIIILSALVATIFSTVAALLAVKLLSKMKRYQMESCNG
jgi:spore maturation protein A